MTEQELVEGIVNKNESAFRELVQLYQKQVINTCFGFLGNYEDAQDVAQDVFIKVYESAHSFRKESKISTWIYRIAVNESINHKKRLQRKKWLKYFDFLNQNQTNDIENNDKNYNISDAAIELDERNSIINKALDKLPENQRIAFTLHKYDDIPYQQISEIMNISLSAVESLIFRAKQNLQKYLVNYFKN
jgi:RNA polymerase sigma-70 factor (ECF subfamily)